MCVVQVALFKGAERYAKSVIDPVHVMLACLSGNGYGKMNDGTCDCSDGSDEPSTVACAGAMEETGQLFKCHQGGESVKHSAIGDGACDCCDGSDEHVRDGVHCPHACTK